MPLKIMQETTEWAASSSPNHVYLMSGDKVLAYSRWGKSPAETLRTPLRIDRRGRKFLEVKQNLWQFDLSMTDTAESESQPAGQTWQVAGSRGAQYTVSLNQGHWACTCPGHNFRGKCRHVDEMSASIKQIA